MKDRTLDQQCTVTRPGLAQIASGLAAEMLVALVHAPVEDSGDEVELGVEQVPHQIRGFLHNFEQMLPHCQSFVNCTACSEAVVSEYRKVGAFDFVRRICDDPLSLQDISGLTKLMERMDSAVEGDDVMFGGSDDDF